ncbi:hypothetical protein LguiB_024003 [Lonicera macranthoides]
MAIAICSSSSTSISPHSPTLPTVSVSSLKPKNPSHIHPSPLKSSLNLPSYNALALAEASTYEIEKDLGLREGRNNGLEREWGSGSRERRRKRRRRRRKKLGFEEIEGEDERVLLFRNANSGQYLTTKEEAEYAQYIQEEARLEAVQRRIKELNEHEPTSNQWAKAVGMRGSSLEKVLCNGRESKERILRCYKRLVISIASSYQGKGLTSEDLVQEGSIGLLRGAKKFDPGRGCKMSTYVYWWIRQAITSAVAKKSRIISLPGNVCEMIPKIAEANNILTTRLRRSPSLDEIAQVVNIAVATVRLVYQITRDPISLDQATTNCMSLQEIIPGPDERRPETIVMKQQMKQELENLLKILCEREAYILRLHYGLDGVTPQSFDEIGRLLKLSRERVRQINRMAISKLRHSIVVDNFELYMM